MVLTITVLVFTSCTRDKSPDETVIKFLNALNDNDFKTAREVSTPETHKMVDLMETLAGVSTAETTKPGNKIEIIDTKIEGDNAWVKYNAPEMNDGEEEMFLMKVDGKWLVHITKEDIATKDIQQEEDLNEEGLWEDIDDDHDHSDSVTNETNP